MTGLDEPTAAALLAQAERCELFRIAAVGMLANPRLDPASKPWAEHWAGMPRLQQGLSTGEPLQLSRVHLQPQVETA